MTASLLLRATLIGALMFAAFACDESDPAATAGGNAATGGDGGQGGMGMGGSSGGAGGTGGIGAGGAGGAGVHGCNPASATDRTGQAMVVISDISPWTFGHQACVRVDPGTVVRWNTPTFGLHPLTGGIAPTSDAASPIAQAMTMTGGADEFRQATLADAGDYPYFCMNHNGMQGVIFVGP